MKSEQDMTGHMDKNKITGRIWLCFLIAVIAIGVFFYLRQLSMGLSITGMNQNITWGLYISQFTFLVGIAASAVMLILPY